MIAFSTDSINAITSIVEISQSSQLAPLPKMALAKSEKIVRGSARAGLPSFYAPRTTTKAIGIIV